MSLPTHEYRTRLQRALEALDGLTAELGTTLGLSSDEVKIIRDGRAAAMLKAAQHLYTSVTGQAARRAVP